jgi:hypothetical protein
MFEVLIDVLDKEPEFRFTLDGQTIMLDDYLEVRPDRRSLIQEFIRDRRLSIGPMYNLSDVYCTGTEALIRNIQEGVCRAREFGGNPKMLHMADTFGITPSMPMVCAGFKLRAFSFMRGHPEELPDSFGMRTIEGATARRLSPRTRMFRWRSADGSEIPVFRLRDGYASGAGLARYLHEGEAESGLEADLEELFKRANAIVDEQGEPHVLMAGVDHQIPQARLPRLLALANERQDAFRFRLALYDEVAEKVANYNHSELDVYEGEFHGCGAASVLGGTISTRIDLKATNAFVERLLTDSAEPATAFVNWLGRCDPSGCCLRVAWRHLLRAHPHDDICGCSVDAVHRLDENTIEEARHAADAVRRRMVVELAREYGMNAARDTRPSFVLMTMQGRPTHMPVRVPLDFEGLRAWGDMKLPPSDGYRVVDDAGVAVPFREVWRGQSVEHPHQSLSLDLYPEFRPARFTRFYLEPDAQKDEPRDGRTVLENEFLRFEAGTSGRSGFCLVEKLSGCRWENLGFFSSQADIGDEYDFADIPNEVEQVFGGLSWKVTNGGGRSGVQCLIVETTMMVPESSDRLTRKRSAELVELPVRTEFTLGPAQRQLDVRVKFVNRARTTHAGLKLRVIERPVGKPPVGSVAPRVAPIHPADEFVAVVNPDSSKEGLAVFSRFPFEYECLAAQQRLALTILRAVGWLCSPVELTTRTGLNAGPTTLTPEAQCLNREFDFWFAIRPFSNIEPAELLEESLLWRGGTVYGQLDASTPFVEQKVLDPTSLYQVAAPVVVVGCKPDASGQGAYLRLFNPTARPVTAEILLAREGALTPVTLNETVDSDEQPAFANPGNPARFPLQPYAWITLRIG